MSSGIRIRKNSIAFSALIGSIGGTVLEIASQRLIDELINKDYFKDSIILRVITFIFFSILAFLLCLLVIKFFVWLLSQNLLEYKFLKKK